VRAAAPAGFFVEHRNGGDVAVIAVEIDVSRALARVEPLTHAYVLVAAIGVAHIDVNEVHRITIDAELDALELARALDDDRVSIGAVAHIAHADLRPC
jgi:hypothetical protein